MCRAEDGFLCRRQAGHAVAISAWRNSSAFPNSLPFFDVKADAAPLEMGHDTAGQLKGGTAPAFLPGLIQGQQRGGTGLAAGEPGQPGHGPVVKTQPQSRMRLPQQCAGQGDAAGRLLPGRAGKMVFQLLLPVLPVDTCQFPEIEAAVLKAGGLPCRRRGRRVCRRRLRV